MAGDKPTVFIVHGLWQTPVHFQPFIQRLKDCGFPTICPWLPSTGQLPPVGFLDDTKCIHNTLKRLVEEEHRTVLVVAHGYGGVVVSEAVGPEFSLRQRKRHWDHGGVLRILFVTACLIPIGESMSVALQGAVPQAVFYDVGPDSPLNARWPPLDPANARDIKTQGMCILQDSPSLFYHDLSRDEQLMWTMQLQSCPMSLHTTLITRAEFRHHPIMYLYCLQDRILTYEMQQKMVKTAMQHHDIEIEEVLCDAGHVPFLSQPKAIVLLIIQLVSNKR